MKCSLNRFPQCSVEDLRLFGTYRLAEWEGGHSPGIDDQLSSPAMLAKNID
jgi:hypothetical protein